MTELRPNPRLHLPFNDLTTTESDDGTPVILLHGFGGDRVTWVNIQTALSVKKRSLAFDLPDMARP